MRCLGLDLGSKTLGIAISDRTNFIASVYKTIFFKDEDYSGLIEPLREIIKNEEIGTLVLGLPKNMNTCSSFCFAPFMDFDAAGGAGFGAQAAADTFCLVHNGIASPVNRNCAFGAGFHTNAAGNAYLAICLRIFFGFHRLSSHVFFSF